MHVVVGSFVRNRVVVSNALHTTRPQSDLMEFFDTKENWAAKSVKVGKMIFVIISYSLIQ